MTEFGREYGEGLYALCAEEHIERALYRIKTLAGLGFDPYCMIYDKPHAPQEIKDLQRWCNNKIIFKKVPDFKDYKPTRKLKGERT